MDTVFNLFEKEDFFCIPAHLIRTDVLCVLDYRDVRRSWTTGERERNPWKRFVGTILIVFLN